MVVQGFDDAVSTVWLSTPDGKASGMCQTIKSLCDEPGKTRKLYLGGHSLGGALATNAAARLAYVDDVEITAIYTIGSPRCVFSPRTKPVALAALDVLRARAVFVFTRLTRNRLVIGCLMSYTLVGCLV